MKKTHITSKSKPAKMPTDKLATRKLIAHERRTPSESSKTSKRKEPDEGKGLSAGDRYVSDLALIFQLVKYSFISKRTRTIVGGLAQNWRTYTQSASTVKDVKVTPAAKEGLKVRIKK